MDIRSPATTVAADPTTSLGAATKQYVDSNFTKKPAAPAAFHPTDPTATASTTLVMMGAGGTVTYTPVATGHVMIVCTGVYNVNTTATNMQVGGRFGTGTAPSNGAAVTGTRWGGNTDPTWAMPANVAGSKPFAFTDILSLTASTAYWFDIAIATSNASDTAFVANLSFALHELPT